MTLNSAVLVSAVEWALRDHATASGHWTQTSWVTETDCGTTGCVAGHIVTQAGYKPEFDRGRAHRVKHPLTGELRAVSVVARELLGLTDDWDEAWPLFAGTNGPDDLRREADTILARHGHPRRFGTAAGVTR